MKKLILTLTMIVLTQAFSQAFAVEEPVVLNLHSDGAYILDFNNRPMEIQVTNPRVIKVEVVTDLYTDDAQLVIKTLEEGISYVSFKVKNQPKTIKILVDDKADVDKDLIEIDKVKEP